MKNVLITGISGQDGIFLAHNFLKKEPETNIFGISRNTKGIIKKLKYLDLGVNTNNLNLISGDLTDLNLCKNILNEVRFDQIYNLSGPSNVYESLNQPVETKNNIIKIFNNLTENIIKSGKLINFFQASSSEMYGNNGEKVLDEKSKFNPNSAYAEAKLINHKKILMYKNELNWNITSGIMFNHESEFRKNNFLFMKIINKALEIKKKNKGFLEVGSLDYKRDWSYAQDIVDAMYLINKNPKSGVYVIGSGSSYSIERIIDRVFNVLNLDYKNYIKVNPKLLRDGDPVEIFSNPQKLKNDYRWEPKYNLESFIKKIINYQNLVK
tara:strand:- start:788 stop:1759 length:972 start_codon:yes stop_codon:yes gene_type:complete